MNKKKAVLFDYDGVLANTMEDVYSAWKHAFYILMQISIPRNTFFQLEGYSAYDMAKALSNQYDIPSSYIENIIQEKEEYYIQNHKFSLNPRINEILQFLKKKEVILGIVSGAPRSRIKKMLGESMYNNFHIVIGAEDYKKGKPDPDPYNRALLQLHLQPLDVIIIENAPLGIASAKSAGAFCVAVQSTLEKHDLRSADIIVEDFDRLFSCLISIFS